MSSELRHKLRPLYSNARVLKALKASKSGEDEHEARPWEKAKLVFDGVKRIHLQKNILRGFMPGHFEKKDEILLNIDGLLMKCMQGELMQSSNANIDGNNAPVTSLAGFIRETIDKVVGCQAKGEDGYGNIAKELRGVVEHVERFEQMKANGKTLMMSLGCVKKDLLKASRLRHLHECEKKLKELHVSQAYATATRVNLQAAFKSMGIGRSPLCAEQHYMSNYVPASAQHPRVSCSECNAHVTAAHSAAWWCRACSGQYCLCKPCGETNLGNSCINHFDMVQIDAGWDNRMAETQIALKNARNRLQEHESDINLKKKSIKSRDAWTVDGHRASVAAKRAANKGNDPASDDDDFDDTSSVDSDEAFAAVTSQRIMFTDLPKCMTAADLKRFVNSAVQDSSALDYQTDSQGLIRGTPRKASKEIGGGRMHRTNSKTTSGNDSSAYGTGGAVEGLSITDIDVEAPTGMMEFETAEDAMKALQAVQGHTVNGKAITVTLDEPAGLDVATREGRAFKISAEDLSMSELWDMLGGSHAGIQAINVVTDPETGKLYYAVAMKSSRALEAGVKLVSASGDGRAASVLQASNELFQYSRRAACRFMGSVEFLDGYYSDVATRNGHDPGQMGCFGVQSKFSAGSGQVRIGRVDFHGIEFDEARPASSSWGHSMTILNSASTSPRQTPRSRQQLTGNLDSADTFGRRYLLGAGSQSPRAERIIVRREELVAKADVLAKRRIGAFAEAWTNMAKEQETMNILESCYDPI